MAEDARWKTRAGFGTARHGSHCTSEGTVGQGASVATLLDPVPHDCARMRRGREGADGAVVAGVKDTLPGGTLLALPAQNVYSDRFPRLPCHVSRLATVLHRCNIDRVGSAGTDRLSGPFALMESK